MYKSENFAQSQLDFARTHVRVFMTLRNSAQKSNSLTVYSNTVTQLHPQGRHSKAFLLYTQAQISDNDTVKQSQYKTVTARWTQSPTETLSHS